MKERKCIRCESGIGAHPCLCSEHLREMDRLCEKLPEFDVLIRDLYSKGKSIPKILDKVRLRMFKLTLDLGRVEREEKRKREG